jgi:hypothetical protein
MNGDAKWIFSLGIGILLLIVAVIFSWRRARTSFVWRFIFCFFVACLIAPVSFNNGHSAGWMVPAIFMLAGLFSGQRDEFLFAVKIIGFLILPMSLILFGIWSVILFLKKKKTKD